MCARRWSSLVCRKLFANILPSKLRVVFACLRKTADCKFTETSHLFTCTFYEKKCKNDRRKDSRLVSVDVVSIAQRKVRKQLLFFVIFAVVSRFAILAGRYGNLWQLAGTFLSVVMFAGANVAHDCLVFHFSYLRFFCCGQHFVAAREIVSLLHCGRILPQKYGITAQKYVFRTKTAYLPITYGIWRQICVDYFCKIGYN